jgi:phosphate transport system substrate-binding protein
MDKALRIVSVLTVIFSVGFIASVAQAQGTGKTIIRVRGANTMATMIDKVAKSFAEVHPDCAVAVSGGGMPEGLKALMDKTANVAMATRETSSQEKQLAAQKGIKLVEQLVGVGAIAIVAHPANPVKELTVEQVRKTFAGEYTDWNDLGGEILPIVLYVGDATRSGMAQYFNESILKTTPPYVNLRRYYHSIIKDVSSRADAAGYVPLALALEAQIKGTIKILAVKKDADSPAILPSNDTVASRAYPLLRPLFLCYDGNAAGKQIKQFVDFCTEKCMSLR